MRGVIPAKIHTPQRRRKPMQTIRIIIRDGKAQSVEFSDTPRRKPKQSIPAMLRSMPKELLAKALSIPTSKGESADV